MENKLRGSLLKKIEQDGEEESKLKGKLLENGKEEIALEEYSEEWLKTKTLIQRDGGDEFKVKDIITQTYGSNPRRMVQLISLKDSHTFNNEFSKIIGCIKTPGSAWKIKE